jgi:hypothetical protein
MNPLMHALIFLAAVIIPGGLLAYFAWRAFKSKQAIAKKLPTPHAAATAFRNRFPVKPVASVRDEERQRRLHTYHASRQQDPPKN